MRLRTSSGFTLIEAAIVLLVVGLLIAGIVKGQELLAAARVRGVIQEVDGFRTAYFGFQDRFHALAGDYAAATSSLNGVSLNCGVTTSPGNGNGNGFVQAVDGEAILLWEHLSKSNLLTGAYTCEGNAVVNAKTVPRNRFGQFVQIIYDANYAGEAQARHNFKTGNDIPSDILAEVDRKIDDGRATSGRFRGSTYTPGAATDPGCWEPGGVWNSTAAASNCGAAVLF